MENFGMKEAKAAAEKILNASFVVVSEETTIPCASNKAMKQAASLLVDSMVVYMFAKDGESGEFIFAGIQENPPF